MFSSFSKRPTISNTDGRSLLLPTGPWTHETVYAGGLNFHVVCLQQPLLTGTQPPVFFLHDFANTWLQWQSLLPLLTDFSAPVYALDARGFGNTDLSASRPTAQLLASDIRALAYSLGYSQINLVGVGMGAVYAAVVKYYYPDLVADTLLFTSDFPRRFVIQQLRKPKFPTAAYEYAFNRVFAWKRAGWTAKALLAEKEVVKHALGKENPLSTELELSQIIRARWA
ncbi:hypothetical protein HMPREF0044_0266 [Gleimia coleocanis DSM 15436]|uniref:AB hydrolase-1 domain-containing protein n=1 Tax=Gleimia coleocanis DSM 15436 TaxID=525245 RepID=C0VYM6_9ACTO|nr:alpha/beta hydrolase [Gleimia coleocanis]EEH64529.1 hypothetical protein HMPREF0044_0266 [Gleimia coleocanis DSM 15436]